LGEYAGTKLETIIAEQADAVIKLQSMKNDTQIQEIFAGITTSMEKTHQEMQKMCDGYDTKINQFQASVWKEFQTEKAYLDAKERKLDKSILVMQELSSKQAESIDTSLKILEEQSKAHDEKFEKKIVSIDKTILEHTKMMDELAKSIEDKNNEIDAKIKEDIESIRKSIKGQLTQFKKDLDAEYGNDSFRKTTDKKIEGLKKYVNQLLGTKPDGADTSQQSTPAPPQAATNQPKGKKKK